MKPTSFRLSEMTSRQLERLVESTGHTRGEIVAMAIDRMYQQEAQIMSNQMTIRDATTGEMITAYIDHRITSVDAIGEPGAELRFVEFEAAGVDWQIAVFWYEDGTTFSTDWQGQQPESWDDIQNYSWWDGYGRPAIMLDGMPHVLA